MAVGMVKGFASLKLMLQFGNESYAVLSQFMVVSAFGAQLLILSYDTPYVMDMVKGDKHFIGPSVLLNLIGINFLIGLTVVLFLGGMISECVWGSSSYSWLVFVMVLYIASMSINLITLYNYQASKSFAKYSAFQIAQQILQLLSVVVGVWFDSVITVVSILLLSEWLLIIYGWMSGSLAYVSSCFEKSVVWLKNKSIYSLPMLISFLSIWTINNGGRISVVNVGGLNQLAIYSATTSIAILSGSLINPICTAYLPKLCRVNDGSQDGECNSFLTAWFVLVSAIGFFSIILLVLTENLLELVAKSDLFAGNEFVLLVCLAQLFYGESRLYSLYLTVRGQAKYGLYAYAISAILFSVVVMSLTNMMDLVGAATALMLSMGAARFLLYFKLKDDSLIKFVVSRHIFHIFWLCTVFSIIIACLFVNLNTAYKYIMCFFDLLFFALLVLILRKSFVQMSVSNLKDSNSNI